MFDRKKYMHEHYLANKDKYLKASMDSKKRLRLEKKQTIIDAKSKPCVDCGIQYPSPVMQFDHVNGQKVTNVSEMVRYTYTMDRLLTEIAKCDVVCSNCHALRTYNRRNLNEIA